MSDDTVAIDLFCGAGGFSEGLRQACRESGCDLKHAAINHWEPAVETHERNHPDAHQYHSKVEQLHPPKIIDALVDADVTDVHTTDVDVDLLVAGPECTHFSSARGGKPVNEQKRMSPWHVLDWLEKLNVNAFIIENVNEIQSWGPVEDGQPTRDGSVFDAWINALNGLGYSVEWTTLTAADYGDPTSRERFFLVGRQDGKATFPAPTHSDSDPDKHGRRTAAEIIDWSDLGGSIWTRDLTNNRVHTPPKNTTMQRIAEGIRRHCDDRLEPFADALEELGNGNEDDPVPTTVQGLRDRVVPAAYADAAAAALSDPFLVQVPRNATTRTSYILGQHSNSVAREVGQRPAPTITKGGKLQLCTAESCLVKYYGTSPPQPVNAPLDTVTANGYKYAVSTAESIILRQQDGGPPWSVSDRPIPTVPTKGGHAIATPALMMPKNYPKRGIHSNGLYRPEKRPFHTVTSEPRAKVVSPYLCPLYNPRPGQRPRTRAVDRPLMTIPASKSPAAVTTPLVRPFLDDYEGAPQPITQPLGTLTKRDRYALCVPEIWPWGLDIKYRMLQPRELKQAQGFPEDYEIVGTKEARKKQIGNAVPVTLAKNLCKHVLTAGDPSLASYGGGITADDGAEVPDYENVVADGGLLSNGADRSEGGGS